MRRAAVIALLACVASCGAEPPADTTAFIALDRDFQGFRAWPRVPLSAVSAGGHPEGPGQYVYVSRARPSGARDFAVGTMLVRTFELPTLTSWEIFAMAKRGGGFNADGDAGWEFFRLRLDAQGRVVIVARGIAPRTDTVDTYSTGDHAGCNACHGTADARVYDGLLSLALRPPDP